MKKKLVLMSIIVGFLCFFSSLEVVLANITVDYTLPTIWLIIIGGFVFFLALVGWILIDWLRRRKRSNS